MEFKMVITDSGHYGITLETKARGEIWQEKSLKRLKKLRKWMDTLNPAMQLNMGSFKNFQF